ncbi:Na+/H+ antiporter NhaC [Rossellomorea aquimaris]|jgi:Na+:H+ antiporter, NhaC family|uniref:Na+/H+ antiporter NhaC n=1 Tax=Rossellomorea aquimaris TaxID=189382 RepID=A0A5D4UMR0_9BACI|nr:Na+/H+ antiporter NhaC [Rossellomorea aquimaris]TYS81617.1 Na+/H+ antiporter NhaC [Rossellomorea aquimaris]TYS88241.1 Na+/H+ antiporter NhaC [Rossellomorea aquimaris]
MSKEGIRRPSVGMALIPIMIALVIFIGGIGILKYQAELMLIFAGVVFSIYAIWCGHKWEKILTVMGEKIKTALPAILILFSIGLIIGTWMLSGTIPFFVYYGLEIIHPGYLYVLAFIVTAIVSTCVGTSWGSAGTIGVALMSIAQTMDVSLAITAGAVVSGAYFGDKLSPLSDTTNMSSLAAGSNLYEHIQHMMYTSIPSSIIAIIVFYFAGLSIESTPGQLNNIEEMLSGIDQLFNLNVLVLLPAVIVIAGSLMKKSPLIVLFSSALTAMIIAFFFQQATVAQLFTSAVEGFNVEMVTASNPGLDPTVISESMQGLLNRGGLYSMYNATFFVFCAFFFAAAIEVSQALNVVLEKIISYLKSIGSVIFASLVTGFAVINCTSNALVTYFLIKDIFGDVYKKKKLHPVNLSRSMEDSVTITEALMPWTVSGVFMATTLGVSNFEFLPWAIFNLGGFVFSLLYGFLAPYSNNFGIRNLTENEVEEDMESSKKII